MAVVGPYTLLQLREEIEANLGSRPDDATTQVRLNSIINLAQMRLAREAPWPELNSFAQVSRVPTGAAANDKFLVLYGASSYPTLNLESRVRKISALWSISAGGNVTKLIALPERQWNQIIGDAANTTGGGVEATYYTKRDNNMIEWWPVPTATFTLQYEFVLWPDQLVNDNDANGFVEKDDLIVALATHMAFMQLGQKEDAGIYFATYQAMLNNCKESDLTQEDVSFMNRGVSEDSISFEKFPYDYVNSISLAD